jgi:hypothetical protein
MANFWGRNRSIARQIQIGKKQSKNRMVGQTFNPSGITSQMLDDRERQFVEEMKSKSSEERNQYWENAQELQEIWQGSWPWEWCAFQRNFT